MAKNNGIKITVLGLGKSGIACANLAISKGYTVFASDSGKVRTHKQMKLNKNYVKNAITTTKGQG